MSLPEAGASTRVSHVVNVYKLLPSSVLPCTLRHKQRETCHEWQVCVCVCVHTCIHVDACVCVCVCA